jgi:hypothetical protein
MLHKFFLGGEGGRGEEKAELKGREEEGGKGGGKFLASCYTYFTALYN